MNPVTIAELCWLIITLLCVISIIYILVKKIDGADLPKAIVASLLLVIVLTSLYTHVLIEKHIQPVYVDLPEEWEAIDTNDFDTLLVSKSPNGDTLYTSFLLNGFTDSEVEQEIDSIHDKWLQLQESK
jgi:hypothetical protein